ncbi:MAG: hypothetical protein SFX73_26390 [Kofleriaceae bacterium]|nr:hypothetical protein [Kofleriaceae bacterium]
MTRAVLVSLALGLGGCDDATDKALDEASALADKLCACPDAACASAVQAELDAMKARREGADDEPASGKQTQRAVKIAVRWDECMDKVSRRSK